MIIKNDVRKNKMLIGDFQKQSNTMYPDQHFIKPLFPGFEDELLIPAAFMKYLKGPDGEIAMLRSRREGKLWPVKINGRQFGDGWNQFVQDHDLQLGDCLLFRHEGDLVFYVLVFGHNTCEREYPPFIAIKEEPLERQEQNLPTCGIEEEPIKTPVQNLPKDCSRDRPPFSATEEEPIEIQEQNLKCYTCGKKLENMKAETQLEAKASSSAPEHPHCIIQLAPKSIGTNRLFIPLRFARESGIRVRTCSVILTNDEAGKWTARLLYNRRKKSLVIGNGWSEFRSVHKLKEGDLLMVELVKNGGMPVFKMRRLGT